MPARSTDLVEAQKTIPLLVHGQGVFLFSTAETAAFTFFDKNRVNALSVEFFKEEVSVVSKPSGEVLKDDTNNSGLVDLSGAYYWFSVDSQNEILYAGVGEARLENVIYTYNFSDALKESSKLFLESLTHIVIHEDSPSLVPMKLLRDPITASVPLKIADTATLTMEDVASGAFMPKANLPATAQKLYDCIAGSKFTLETKGFPDFYKAIEYSIATPGCWCYETLQKKATEFSKDRPNIAETYLRITLGQNNGESPGIPYVMEIWPKGHFSPVHSHSEAEAVIRVLEGGIHVELYPFLSAGVEPFGSGDFVKGDVMWISPTLNQTHQLKNIGTTTCITIQCYMYDSTDDKHYDYFDYLDDKGAVQQYEPDSDMDFLEFKKLMLHEWAMRPRCFCLTKTSQ
jgi:uncharacterized cupin superfamily protein